MREPVRDRERLEHIVEAIANILDFADGKTKEELEANTLISMVSSRTSRLSARLPIN